MDRYKIKSIAKDIYDSKPYSSNLIRWKFGAEVRRPTLLEIETMLLAITADMEDVTSVTAGGLVVEKTGSHIDVYLYMGDVG